jgi:hypothetical protein
VTWLMASKNTVLLEGLNCDLQCFSWEERAKGSSNHYDLVIRCEEINEFVAFAEEGRVPDPKK